MSAKSDFSVVERLVNPRSIAIMGASETSMYGKGIINALRNQHYPGKIFPINPKRDEVLGVKCFKTLSAIEEEVDLAIVIIGRNQVFAALEECEKKRVKGVLIITSGFAEADEEGKALEARVREFALAKNLPVWGPNCAGFANFRDGVIATLLREEGREFLSGRAGFVSQSGALVMALIGTARDKGLGLNYAISTGNEVDLETTDFIEYMLHDPSNRVVAAFVEGFKDIKKFVSVTELALEKGTPLCILKVGRSQLGERAAASHTGSITGADVAYETLFQRNGVIRAIDTDELIEMAKVCSLAKRPSSNGIALITSSGGLGSLSADLCADYGLNLADLSPKTREKLIGLEELLTFGSVANPIDVRGQGIRALEKVLPIVVADDQFGMVVIAMSYSAVGKEANGVATVVRDAVLRTDSEKPVFVLWVGRRQRTPEVLEGFEILEGAGIPVFSEPQKCWKAIRKLLDFERARVRYLEKKQRPVTQTLTHAEEVRSVLDRGKGMLVESDFKEILALYGISVTRERIAGSPGEAAEIAAGLGYPVALKVMSPQLLHKTEAKVIELNVAGPDQLRSAYEKILRNASTYDIACRVRGVLVQEMVRPGVEVILGMKKDPQFGPLALFGLGGIFVEIFKDVSFFFPPITRSEAHELIQRVKGYPILQGARGRKQADIPALVETMVQFSHLCVDTCRMFKEIDLNPLIVAESGSGLKVVDALMVPC